MLHSVLGVILAVGWLLFAAFTLVSFWRSLRHHGPYGAMGRLLSYRFVVPFLLMVGLSIVKASLVFVYPHQMGVVVSLLSNEGIRTQPLRSGLHWIVPLAEKVELYPLYWQTYTMSYKPSEGQHKQVDAVIARTKDSQEVMMDISIIFRIDPEQVVHVHRYWQDRYMEELLRPGVRGFIRSQVSQYTVDEVNSDQRVEIGQLLDRDIKKIARENGLIVKQVLLRNIAFTPEYAASVERKQVALEGKVQKEHEAKQIENLAKGQANKIEIVAKAEAQAVKIKAKAAAEARIIRAEAEAEALNLVASALKDKQNLLTYRYITRLSPNVQAVVLPHDMPLIFPLPDMQAPKAPENAVQSVNTAH